MIIAAVVIYVLAVVLTVLYGGLHISEISIIPIAFAAATVWMAFVWHLDEAPDTANMFDYNDVTLTYGEKRTMFLVCAKVLGLSLPLQLMLIFTWSDLPKGFFSIFIFFAAIIIGFHLGRRKIRDKVYARMDEQKRDTSN